MVIHIQRNNHKRLFIKFTYTVERVTKIKTIIGYRWNPENKYWTVPDTVENIERLFELFKDEQIFIQSTCSSENIRQYLLDLLEKDKSHAYVNQAVSSIKFLSIEVLQRRDIIIDLPDPKRNKNCPIFLVDKRFLKY